MSNRSNQTHSASITVKDMDSTNQLLLTKRLRVLGFNLTLSHQLGRLRKVFIHNYIEDKVDSSAMTTWIINHKGSIVVHI